MGAYRRLVVHRQVLVNLVNGQAVQGVLVRQRGPLLFVANATLLEPDTEPTPLDGEIVIERDRVAFVQAL
ncbi:MULTISPECIES: hypothetical protein [unclassified Leucobacter]|uniref:hypothetical protein n=1 Tax=unclassified Leucobacter TaxID=2621730 RepID=UPI0006219C86|nr:hypothetical protein [Leucobacter sp. Ag1]KKI16380.1 hypothetical protein XM48_16425 [Leucobacter sp. Ag1]